jgi:death on curing protein
VDNINFLSLDEILAIHHDQIERYGGSHGIRDLDLLMSALSRPQATFAGSDLYPDLFSKASALIHSLILNHPFVDGNKRTAIVSTARFLFINGFMLKMSEKELVNLPLKINSKSFDQDEISSWLKKHSEKI